MLIHLKFVCFTFFGLLLASFIFYIIFFTSHFSGRKKPKRKEAYLVNKREQFKNY